MKPLADYQAIAAPEEYFQLTVGTFPLFEVELWNVVGFQANSLF
jgi:hypothetical protein